MMTQRSAEVDTNRLEQGLTESEISPSCDTVAIDKALFKELLQLTLSLPDLGSKLVTVDTDCGTTPTGETLVHLNPGDFLLRLNAALRTCG